MNGDIGYVTSAGSLCGVGRPAEHPPTKYGLPEKNGLGTSIVKALAQQLGAQVETLVGAAGTTVSITHATFSSKAIRDAQIAAMSH
jgi:hypothetical protein